MKKYLSMVLALVMLLAVSTTAQAAVTEKGMLPIVDEPITLKIAFPVNSKVEDMSTNQLTLWVEETTGINIEWIELSTTDTATQINMMMNSSDLPDVIMGYDFPYDVMCSYADAGLIVSLDEQYEKYAENVYNYIVPDLGENTLSYVTYDGQKWAVPSGGQPITNVYGGVYCKIQNNMLETLGMELPHTLDELYAFLVAVRDNDVNGNGDPSDEIPMTAYANVNFIFQTISNAYQYTDKGTYLKVNDGVVSCIANNELFREAILYVKKLVDEKLVDPAAFTQDESVLATQLAQEGDNVAILAVGTMYTNVMDSTGDEYINMRMLPNLEGPYGYKSTMHSPATVRISGVITSACENVDAAFRFLDFFLSDDVSVTVRVGFEGEQWAPAEEGVIGRDGEQAWFSLLTTQEWVQPSTNVIWDSESFIHSNVMSHCEDTAMSAKFPASIGIKNNRLVEEVTGERLPQMLLNAEDFAEFHELKTLIVDKINEAVSMFVLGDRDIEEFDDFCNELKAMGLDRYIELAQTSVDTL